LAEPREPKIVTSVLEGEHWGELDSLEHDSIRDLLSDPQQMIWIDLSGDPESVTAAFVKIARGCGPLAGLVPSRAAKGGENPPARPPKAKAFHDSVFARTYWLGTQDNTAPQHPKAPRDDLKLIVQEIHLIVGKTFAITLRYPCRAWGLDQMAHKTTPDHYKANNAGLNRSLILKDVMELRERFGRTKGQQTFGLEVAAAVLDAVIGSIFDSLDGLRLRADKLEEDVLRGEWLWAKKKRNEMHPGLEDTMLGLRRLLRQVRWTFMPADEIDEFCSGPFLGIEARDPAIKFTFSDLGHEAERAVASVRDITEQLEHTVGLSNTMKTDRLNSTMYVLTAVATILLIPTVIAGIYGMNFRHMPELNWRLGYGGALVAMIALGNGIWFGLRRYLKHRDVR